MARGMVLRNAWLCAIGVILMMLTCAPARGGASDGQRQSAERSKITGKVYGAGSHPLPMARVQLQPAVGSFFRTAYTDSSGHFSFGSVPSGKYAIEITASGYATGHWSVAVDHHPLVGLTFALTPAGSSQQKDNSSPEDPYTVSVHQLLIPEKARMEYLKGVKSEVGGKIDDAIHHWKKAIRIWPQYAESYMRLSQVYADRGEFDRALADARRAVKIDSKDGDAYTYLGYVYLKKQDLPKAEEAFGSAVRLSDSEWFSEFWLGKLLINRNKARLAYPHLLRANQMKPEMPEPYLLLYNDLLSLGRGKEALADIDAFLARFPQHPLAAKLRERRKALAKSLEEKKP